MNYFVLIIKWLFSNLTIRAAHGVSHISPCCLFTVSIPVTTGKGSVNSGEAALWLTGKTVVLAGETVLHRATSGTAERLGAKSRFHVQRAGRGSQHEGLGMGWGWGWGPMLCFFFVILSRKCPQKCTPSCQTQVVALPDRCLQLLAAFAVNQSPGAQVSPQGPSATAPLMPQQDPSPAPSHGPSWAGPTCRPMYWPGLSPSPRRCPMPRAGAAPVPWLPAPGWWDRPWLPGLALGKPPGYTEPWQVWMWTA